MSLTKYNKKRKFDQTPEPSGGTEGQRDKEDKGEKGTLGPLTFVIQKHAATRLHYDFRLELDGVLLSWAVPKGPSLNPEDRHLAVHVEDHPIEYANFEGIIPKGNYGAGTVQVWDRGVYIPYLEVASRKSQESRRVESEKILRKQLKSGHLTFVMLGEKLKGEFALIKTKGSEDDQWLLIKKGDEYADSKKDILDQDKSVISGRSLSEIRNQSAKKNEVWHSQPKSLDLGSAPVHKLPAVIKPMLAQSVDKAFDDPDFIFEVKWDGYRSITEVEAGKVKLYSRNNISFDKKFEPVYESLKKFPGSGVLDGEVVMLDKEGKANFSWIQDYPESRSKGELVYYIFDLLSLNGRDLTKLPLIRRKEILKQVLPPLPHLSFSDHIEGRGKDFYAQAVAHNLEGVIAKRKESRYLFGGRSKDWLKIKSTKNVDAVICGFTKGRGGRKFFGALVLGQVVDGDLKYIGHVGGGFDERRLKEIHGMLEPLVVEKCPFGVVPQTNEVVTWVKPKLFCEVSFSQWTHEGILRHPVFVKMVDSESPPLPSPPPHRGEGTKHQIKSSKNSISSPSPLVGEGRGEGGAKQFRKVRPEKEEPQEIEVGKRILKITNPSKEFFPGEGITKTDLIDYYREMAPFILPYLVNRPQSLLRYPHGISEEGFFQKDTSSLNLDWVMRVHIKSESSHRKEIEFMLCQDEATLVYMVNLGCIDFNPWNSTIKNLEKPDYLIIDLDPEAVSFKEVVRVALKVREYLEKLDIPSFPKTSGGRGMHIFIPMGGNYTHEQVKQFAELLCMHIQVEIPEISSMRRDPRDRQGKVYLDYLQNGKGKTLASVYSVRPKKGGYVSTPLLWEEVNSKLDPSMFTINNTLKRVEKKGDLFKGVLGRGVNIRSILMKLEGRF